MRHEILEIHQIQRSYSMSVVLIRFISELILLSVRSFGVEQLKGNMRLLT